MGDVRFVHMKRLLAVRTLAFVGAAAVGCSEGVDADPQATDSGSGGALTCDDLTCGDNASCRTPDGAASCVCDEGYLGDGEVCEKKGSWIQHTIGAQDNAIYLFTADMGQDGDPDVFVTSSDHTTKYASEVAWYQNEGHGASWTKHILASADVDAAILAANGIVVGDVNEDGRLDAAVASGSPMSNGPGGVYLFEGPEDPTQPWPRKTLLESPDEAFFKIYFVDMNGDGLLDIVAGGAKGAILVNPGSAQSATWQVHRMNEDTGGGLFVGDVDGDSQPDVVNANGSSNAVIWTDVTPQEDGFAFKDKQIAALTLPLDVYLLDVNEDGRQDVLSSRIGGRGFRWFEQPLDGASWREHMIRENFSGTDIYVGDINSDGTEDVLISGLAMMEQNKLPPSIAWFERHVSSNQVSWTTHWIDYGNENLTVPGDVELVDISGDGRLDVVTTSVNDGRVYWYENLIGR